LYPEEEKSFIVRKYLTKVEVIDLFILVTLYTGPKPPSPSLLLLEKLSVALTKTDKSNVVKSRSSFLGLVFQIVQQNFFATPI
jgi:hypothetical protein